jgi:hypothetical protein
MWKSEDEMYTGEYCDEKWMRKVSACKHSSRVSDCCESADRDLFPFGKANDEID